MGTGYLNWEIAIANGIKAAAQVLYGLMLDMEPPRTATVWDTTSLDVGYQAYGWNRGWKGYVWTSLSITALLAALSATIIGMMPRTRYDPSSFVQTIFVALNSKDLAPPAKSSTGAVPKGYRAEKLNYGFVGGGSAQFTHANVSTTETQPGSEHDARPGFVTQLSCEHVM